MTSAVPLRADATDLVAWADRKDPERLLPAIGHRLVLASGVRCRGTGRTRKSSSRRTRSRSSAGRPSATASSSGSRGVSEILLHARQLVPADIYGVEFCVMGERAERRYVRSAVTTYGGEASEEIASEVLDFVAGKGAHWSLLLSLMAALKLASSLQPAKG